MSDRRIRTLLRDKLAVAGIIMILVVSLMSIFAPLLSPFSPSEQNMIDRYSKPCKAYLFGTDEYGRDILSRIIFGSRASLIVGFFSVTFSMLSGTLLGTIAGYFGGKLDDIVMRGIDIMLSFPTLLLGLLIVAILGPGLVNTIIAIAISILPRFARLARGPTVSAKEAIYVEASRACGQNDFRIILNHILPNILGPVLVMGSLWLATAIRIEANLSFLGLGVQPPTPSWGNMIRAGVNNITITPWLAIFPGIAITVAVLSFNMVGDGLRDALDPKLQS